MFNHCFKGTYSDGNFIQVKRSNATEWEMQSNVCYENYCDNETGPNWKKSDNITKWEEQSNACYEYYCDNETGLNSKKRGNTTKWEQQSNACYECFCDNETGPNWKKNEGVTKWENQSNACYEYYCDNETGPAGRSKCATDGKTKQTCVNNECVEEQNQMEEKYSVEVNFQDGIGMNEMNVEFERLRALIGADISLGWQANNQGHIIRVIIYVNDIETANSIATAVNDCSTNKTSRAQ